MTSPPVRRLSASPSVPALKCRSLPEREIRHEASTTAPPGTTSRASWCATTRKSGMQLRPPHVGKDSIERREPSMSSSFSRDDGGLNFHPGSSCFGLRSSPHEGRDVCRQHPDTAPARYSASCSCAGIHFEDGRTGGKRLIEQAVDDVTEPPCAGSDSHCSS